MSTSGMLIILCYNLNVLQPNIFRGDEVGHFSSFRFFVCSVLLNGWQVIMPSNFTVLTTM